MNGLDKHRISTKVHLAATKNAATNARCNTRITYCANTAGENGDNYSFNVKQNRTLGGPDQTREI